MSALEEAGVPDGEVEEVQWVDREVALGRLTYPSDVALLSQALSQGPVSR